MILGARLQHELWAFIVRDLGLRGLGVKKWPGIPELGPCSNFENRFVPANCSDYDVTRKKLFEFVREELKPRTSSIRSQLTC